MSAPELVSRTTIGANGRVVRWGYMVSAGDMTDEQRIVWAEQRERDLLAKGLPLRKREPKPEGGGEPLTMHVPRGFKAAPHVARPEPKTARHSDPGTHHAPYAPPVEAEQAAEPQGDFLDEHGPGQNGSAKPSERNRAEVPGAINFLGVGTLPRDRIAERLAAGLKATRHELARDLGLPLPDVLAAVNELLLSGLIVERSRRLCEVSERQAWALEAA